MTMTATNLAGRHAALSRDLADLRARRPALALAAARGGLATSTELDALEAAIATAERELERLTLAEREAAREAEVDRQRAAADERRRLESEYQAAVARRQDAYRAYEEAVGLLVDRIESATTAGSELDRLANQLGRPLAANWETRLDLIEYLLTRLWVPFGQALPAPGRLRERLADPIRSEGASQ
jgi:hypothetical protein